MCQEEIGPHTAFIIGTYVRRLLH